MYRVHRAEIMRLRGTWAAAEREARVACQKLQEFNRAYAAAAGAARRGCQRRQEVDAPYEAARARMLLAQAHRALGEKEAAALELRAARATFDRLGALPDAGRAADLLGPAGPEAPVPGAQLTRTLMFTQIVRSTALVEAIGDLAWSDLLRWHDQTLRNLFARHGGEEVDHAGDGFFVAFEEARSALECAVAIQRTLAQHRREHGFAPQVRVGLHTAEATRARAAFRGRGVRQAAGIAAPAEAGEVLASRATLEAAGPGFRAEEPGPVALKGLAEPVEVARIDWR
ncbi:MAG TPA: adenylate/guanylate cyclase domain-containing protein [Actinomycetota bacterium]|nr:adenylate/guanylate cyclase domain-containing protein [Actinomycetota bacterium]